MNAPVLSIDRLSFAYGPTPVLRDLSLTLGPGRILAIVGGSGSGKTTLLKCILLLLRPSSGSVAYFADASHRVDFTDGAVSLQGGGPRAMEEEDERAVRTRLGYVPQGSILFPFASLLENIALPLVEVRKAAKAEAVATARKALTRLGVGELANSQPWEVSGGQLQRAAIARAMAVEPALYLLDEPTGALDATNVTLVGEQLRSDVRERGCSAIFVTHNLGFAQAFCDEICVLREGRLNQPAPVASIDWESLVRELL